MKAAVALVLASAFIAQGQENHSLIGRWRSLSASKDGMGATFTFHDDGALEFAISVVVESTYRIDGNRLITPGLHSGEEMVAIIESLSDKLLRTRTIEATDLQLTRKRQGSDPKSSIAGVWKREGGTEEWEFLADSTAKFPTATGQTAKCRYILTGNELVVESERGDLKMTGSLRTDGSVPTITFASMETVKELVREGSPPDLGNLIIGSWQWISKNAPAGPVIVQYGANGATLMVMRMRIEKGHYTLADDRIRLEIEGQPVIEGPLGWDEPVLVIPGPKGLGESRFERY